MSSLFRAHSEHKMLALWYILLLFVISTLLPRLSLAEFQRYDLQIPVPVDTWLAADLYTPDSTVAMPVIFIQTPYNKDNYRQSGPPLNTEEYAFVIMDWRGMYGSAHAAVPLPDYGEDGAVAVEWIAQQAWSNGRIGTYGNSALAQVQYLTAEYHPPHLDCCVPINHSLQADYSKYYQGGVKRTEFVNSLEYWQPIPWLVDHHTTDDWFWTWITNLSNYADLIEVPMLVTTGWWDMSPDDNALTFTLLQEQSDPAVRGEQKLLIGPWCHATVGHLHQGDWEYPNAVGVDEAEALAFLDHWVRDDPHGPYERPAVQYYELGTNEFRSSDIWPPAGTTDFALYLTQEGLSPGAPAQEGSSGFPYNPNHPMLTLGGRTHAGYLRAGPVILNSLDNRTDMLIYDTDVLAEPVEVAGRIHAELYISTNRLDTDVSVLLADVQPNGTAQLITDGIRRLRFRNNYHSQQLAIPGVVYLLDIPMQTMAVTIPAGHRVRLYVTGSNFPRFNRNLNNGGPMYEPGPVYVSTTNVYHGPNHPSALKMTVRSGQPLEAVRIQGIESAELPARFAVSVYPNPFNAAATVQVILPRSAELSVAVYNVDGRRVADLADGSFGAGTHKFSFDASGLASGLYFVRATSPGRLDQVQKLMLVR